MKRLHVPTIRYLRHPVSRVLRLSESSIVRGLISRSKSILLASISATLAVLLLCPVPSVVKIVLTLVAAFVGMMSVGGVIANRMLTADQSRLSLQWRFSLLSVMTGAAIFVVAKSLDIFGLGLVAILVIIFLQTCIFSPVAFGSLIGSNENLLHFLNNLRVSAQVDLQREIDLIKGRQATTKARWFGFLTGICAALTLLVAIVVWIILVVPPVGAILAFAYAIWLTVRDRHFSGLSKAMTWFRNIDSMIAVPIVRLVVQWRPYLAMAVLGTLVEALLPAWLFLIVIDRELSFLTGQQIAFSAAFVISTIIWYSAELYLLIRLFQRLRWYYVSDQTSVIPAIPVAMIPTVITGILSISALLFMDLDLLQSSEYSFLIKLGLLVPIWVAFAFTVWKRRNNYALPFDEQRERRIWMALLAIFSMLVFAIASVIGQLEPIGFGVGIWLLFLFYGEIDLWMGRKLPKSDAAGNFLLYHLVSWVFDALILLGFFWFLRSIGGSLLAIASTAIAGVILLVSSSLNFVHDVRARWAGRTKERVSVATWEILTDNGVTIWAKGSWLCLMVQSKIAVERLRLSVLVRNVTRLLGRLRR